MLLELQEDVPKGHPLVVLYKYENELGLKNLILKLPKVNCLF